MVDVADGAREMDVRVRELKAQKKREWERDSDWMWNAMEEKVMFSQYLSVNRTELRVLTVLLTL